MKKAIRLLAALLLAASLTVSVSAQTLFTPYLGYEINDYEESVAAPVAHALSARYYSRDLGLETALRNPQDMCRTGEWLYVLDSGNGRILQLDNSLHTADIYQGFHDAAGATYDITGAQGLTVGADGTLYIADTEHTRVLICRKETVTAVIERPDSVLLDSDTPFRATKVLADSDKRLYVLAESVNLGAFVFDENGQFLSFFGSNRVVKTAEVISNYIRKRFMTPEQRAGLVSTTPASFSNFDLDERGFLYTVTADAVSDSRTGLVRWLNYKNGDILPGSDTVFGDVEKDGAYWSESLRTQFSDVDVDPHGFLNLLDKGRGKIFQYTVEGELVSVFGGYGEQQGTFGKPVAVESVREDVYVLDAEKGAIFVFSPTRYGASLRQALLETEDNEDSALERWEELRDMNANSPYPYYGIGRICDARGDYKTAMENFKLAGAHTEYSKSLREYRKEWVRANLSWILLGSVSGIAVLIIALRAVKRKLAAATGTAFSAMESRYTFPLYTARHPVDGFEQFRTRNIQSMPLSALLVLLWFLIRSWEYFGMGYPFNMNRAQDYNVFVTLLSTIGVYCLFVVANWAVCTLFDGKGTLREIVAVTAYALLPMLGCSALRIFLSKGLTMEESAFLSLLSVLGMGWSLVVLLAGLYAIHQYSFGGTLLSVLATLVGMFVICFLLILFYSLLQQAFGFIQSLLEEWSMR